MKPTLAGRLAAFAIATTIVWSGEARAQWKCCIVHSGETFLEGFAFQVADTMDVDAWAERFGFRAPDLAPSWDATTRTLLLPRGSLQWTSRPPEPFEGMDASIGRPVPWRYTVCVEQPLPLPEPRENAVATPPNGARRLIGVVAVTAANAPLMDAATFRHESSWMEGPVFAGCFPAPELGAVVCDARYPSGLYRFVTPTDSTGLAARWLGAGPSRWLGVAFEVDDAVATERALSARGVPVVGSRERGDLVVRVMPEATGGPLLEFVQPRLRP